jgi:formate hydrogenlyase transcriptional activator
MSSAQQDEQVTTNPERYRALFSVSDAIASHRDLPALFHEFAGRLGQVVQFDALSLVLHGAATNTMRLHVLETFIELVDGPLEIALSPDDDPAGLVWQTQQPLIVSNIAELSRWPRLLERVRVYGMESGCWLPLTTARRRLGALVFTSRQPSAYDRADIDFLHQVANQVAVAVENALEKITQHLPVGLVTVELIAPAGMILLSRDATVRAGETVLVDLSKEH